MHFHTIDRIVPPCSFNLGHERDPFDPGNLLEFAGSRSPLASLVSGSSSARSSVNSWFSPGGVLVHSPAIQI